VVVNRIEFTLDFAFGFRILENNIKLIASITTLDL